MNFTGAFAPHSASITVAVSNVVANASIPGTGNVVRLANVGSTECFVVVSEDFDPPVAAGTTLSIPGNTIQYLSVSNAELVIEAITAAGTTTLRVTRGSMG